MIVGVTGSRSLTKVPYRLQVRTELLITLSFLRPTGIVHGGASGPDTWANDFALTAGLVPDVVRPLPGSGVAGLFARNRIIVDRCDLLVAVWDGASSGTRSTLEYAGEVSKPTVIVPVELIAQSYTGEHLCN